jgi:hypothetical protein
MAMTQISGSLSIVLSEGQTLLDNLSEDFAANVLEDLHRMKSPIASAILRVLEQDTPDQLEEVCEISQVLEEEYSASVEHTGNKLQPSATLDDVDLSSHCVDDNISESIANYVKLLVLEATSFIPLITEEQLSGLMQELLKMENPVCRIIMSMFIENQKIVADFSHNVETLVQEGGLLVSKLSENFCNDLLAVLENRNSPVAESILNHLKFKHRTNYEISSELSQLIREGRDCLVLLSEVNSECLTGELTRGDSLLAKRIVQLITSSRSSMVDLSEAICKLVQEGSKFVAMISESQRASVIDDLFNIRSPANKAVLEYLSANQNLFSNISELVTQLVKEGHRAVALLSTGLFDSLMNDLLKSGSHIAKAIFLELQLNCKIEAEIMAPVTIADTEQPSVHILVESDAHDVNDQTGLVNGHTHSKPVDVTCQVSELVNEGRELVGHLPEIQVHGVLYDLANVDSEVGKAIIHNLSKDLKSLVAVSDQVASFVKEGLKLAVVLEETKVHEPEHTNSVFYNPETGGIESHQYILGRVSEVVREGRQCLELLSERDADGLINTIRKYDSILALAIVSQSEKIRSVLSELSNDLGALIDEGGQMISVLSDDHVDGIISTISSQKLIAQAVRLKVRKTGLEAFDVSELVVRLVEEGQLLMSLLSENEISPLVDDLEHSSSVSASAILNHLRKNRISSSDVNTSIVSMINEGTKALSSLPCKESNSIVDDIEKMNSLVARAIIFTMKRNSKDFTNLMYMMTQLINEGSECLIMLSNDQANVMAQDIRGSDWMLSLLSKLDFQSPSSLELEGIKFDGVSNLRPSGNDLIQPIGGGAVNMNPTDETKSAVNIMNNILRLIVEGSELVSRLSESLGGDLIDDVGKIATPLAKTILTCLKQKDAIAADTLERISKLLVEGKAVMWKLGPDLQDVILDELERETPQTSLIARAIINQIRHDQRLKTEIKELVGALVIEGRNLLSQISKIYAGRLIDEVALQSSSSAKVILQFIGRNEQIVEDALNRYDSITSNDNNKPADSDNDDKAEINCLLNSDLTSVNRLDLEDASTLVAEGGVCLSLLSEDYVDGLIDDLERMESNVAAAVMRCLRSNPLTVLNISGQLSLLIEEGNNLIDVLSDELKNKLIDDIKNMEGPVSKALMLRAVTDTDKLPPPEVVPIENPDVITASESMSCFSEMVLAELLKITSSEESATVSNLVGQDKVDIENDLLDSDLQIIQSIVQSPIIVQPQSATLISEASKQQAKDNLSLIVSLFQIERPTCLCVENSGCSPNGLPSFDLVSQSPVQLASPLEILPNDLPTVENTVETSLDQEQPNLIAFALQSPCEDKSSEASLDIRSFVKDPVEHTQEDIKSMASPQNLPTALETVAAEMDLNLAQGHENIQPTRAVLDNVVHESAATDVLVSVVTGDASETQFEDELVNSDYGGKQTLAETNNVIELDKDLLCPPNLNAAPKFNLREASSPRSRLTATELADFVRGLGQQIPIDLEYPPQAGKGDNTR